MSDDYTVTANYGLKKPTIAADVDVWGIHWNENADLIDNLIKTQVDDMAGLFLPIAGGGMTGMLTLPATTPTLPTHAVTKDYVDLQIGGGGAGPFLKLSGGTVAGAVIMNGAVTAGLSPVHITGAAGSFRTLRFETAGLGRLSMGLSNTAEGGSDAGSNFVMTTFNDAGVALNNNFLTITRNGGRITLANPNAGITSTGSMGATFGAGNTNGHWQQSNFSGAISYAPLAAFNQWTVASDTMAYTGQQLFLHGIFYNFGGGSYSGNRGGLLVSLTQTGAASGLSPQGGQVAGQFMASATNTLGGSPGSENGGLWGINVYNKLTAAARNVDTVYGAEIDVESAIGSTYLNQIGVAVIATGAHKQAAIMQSLAFGVGGQNGTLGFDTGYQINNWGLQAGSTAFRAEFTPDNTSFNIARGIDLRPVTFSSDILAAAAFAINPTGRVRIGTGTLDPAGTGLDIDTAAAVVTAGTLTASVATTYPLGTNNYWCDDPYGGIWKLVCSGSSITGITLIKPGYVVGAPPANPITLTPRHKLKQFVPGAITANLTWDTTRTVLNVGGTSATAINLGRTASTTMISGKMKTAALLTNAANDAAAASAGVGPNEFYRNGSIIMQRTA